MILGWVNRPVDPTLQAVDLILVLKGHKPAGMRRGKKGGSMAETLVNMVSFRKQVTMEAETVGGPIDVLVITKGDGPVWIKRKHYFNPELNHRFFSNYLK